MKNESGFKRFSIGAIGVFLTLFALIPGSMMVVASVLSRGEVTFFTARFTLDNYLRLFDPFYLRILWNSFYLAALSTLFCLLLGYPFAYLLARLPPRTRRMLLLLVIIPFWTSSLVRTYAMIVILKGKGLVNNCLIWLGLISEPLQLLYSDMAVFLGLVYSLLPFMILPLYVSLEKLDSGILEAARDLGAGTLVTFVRIVLPLTMPGILAGSMLVFLPALGMFYVPDLMGGAKTLLVGNLIKNQFLSARDWPFGAAVSIVLTGVMAVMLWGYYRSIKKLQRYELL